MVTQDKPQVRLPAAATDPRELLRQLARQKWVILGALTVAVTATVFGTLSMPKVYEASATLEYDPSPPRPLGSGIEDVADPVGGFMLAKEWYQTQNMMIKSKTIAARVVDRLALHRDAEFMRVPREQRDGWQGGSKEFAARYLQEALDVRQERDTRIVRVSVDSTDRVKAALLANAVSEAYIAFMMEERMDSTVKAVEWLSGQLDGLAGQLDTSERALHDFKRTNNVLSLSLEDQQNVVAQNIRTFSAALTEASTRRIEIEARLHQLEQANNANPMEVHATLISQSAAMSDLRKNYHEVLIERDTLAVNYGQAHPEIQRVERKIDMIVQQARSEVAGVITVLRTDLAEIKEVETALQKAKQQVQNEGLELNLSQIAYSRLERERANNEKLHALLLQRTAETNLTRMLRVSPVRLIDRATPPSAPIRPRFIVNVIVGTCLGLLGSLALAFLRARMDRSINDPEAVAAAGLNVLGIVPVIDHDKSSAVRYGKQRKSTSKGRSTSKATAQTRAGKDLIVHTHPKSTVAECCRTLRTNLAFMSPDKPLRAISITSPGPEEGKSTVAISLAITMANGGRRVLLIDTDLRRPRLHKAFGMSSQRGITSVLANESSLQDCIQETPAERLWLLPCGPIPPNPSELLHTARFATLLEELKSKFDFLIFDTPPAGIVTDAVIIGPQVDGVLLVAKSGRTTRDALAHTVRQIREVGTNVLGCVLNDVDLTLNYGYGGYYAYYGGGYYEARSDSDDGPGGGSGGGDFAAGLPQRPPAE